MFRKNKSNHRTFEELCATIDAQKDQIPSLIDGGFTQANGSKKIEFTVHDGHAATK
ncbi:hypothetical protein [Bacteroides uniformis]|uniref:hypothetical protein n=1 Tax=Bacteroides uniformis TaxID=820 RepID=UPI00233F152D|nr:hypothetical protein [Bacteroides uniformis]MDC1835629.1 hypothetical protein [Bacteroides uniformis]